MAEAARAATSCVRNGGGLLAIDLSSAAGIHEYGPARMAHVLKDLAPDLLFARGTEAEARGMRLERLAAIPVVKLGASGCTVLGEFISSPPVDEIDATGAGDALAAAFCSSYLRGANPIEAARYAVAVAAGAVTPVGARPGAHPRGRGVVCPTKGAARLLMAFRWARWETPSSANGCLLPTICAQRGNARRPFARRARFRPRWPCSTVACTSV